MSKKKQKKQQLLISCPMLQLDYRINADDDEDDRQMYREVISNFKLYTCMYLTVYCHFIQGDVTTTPNPENFEFTYLGNVTRLIAVETQLIWTMSFYMTNTSTQETYTDFLKNHKNAQNKIRGTLAKVSHYIKFACMFLFFFHSLAQYSGCMDHQPHTDFNSL